MCPSSIKCISILSIHYITTSNLKPITSIINWKIIQNKEPPLKIRKFRSRFFFLFSSALDALWKLHSSFLALLPKDEHFPYDWENIRSTLKEYYWENIKPTLKESHPCYLPNPMLVWSSELKGFHLKFHGQFWGEMILGTLHKWCHDFQGAFRLPLFLHNLGSHQNM